LNTVNTNSIFIRDAINLCIGIIQILSSSSKEMQCKYKEAGINWSDSKYQQLGDIVNECNLSIKKTLHDLNGCLISLSNLEQTVMEYENINLVEIASVGDTAESGFSEETQNSFRSSISDRGSYSGEKVGAIKKLVATLTAVISALMPFLVRLNINNDITVREAYQIRQINVGQGTEWPWIESIRIREDESESAPSSSST